MTIATSILLLIGTIITVSSRSKDSAAAAGPEWYKTLSAEVKDLRGQMREMRGEMDLMRDELYGLHRWRTAALALLRVLWAKVDPADHPVIPSELRDDFDPPSR